MLKFNDGMTVNTEGKLRIIREKDGLYVVGEGMSIPVNSYEEGKEIIEIMDQDRR